MNKPLPLNIFYTSMFYKQLHIFEFFLQKTQVICRSIPRKVDWHCKKRVYDTVTYSQVDKNIKQKKNLHKKLMNGRYGLPCDMFSAICCHLSYHIYRTIRWWLVDCSHWRLISAHIKYRPPKIHNMTKLPYTTAQTITNTHISKHIAGWP